MLVISAHYAPIDPALWFYMAYHFMAYFYKVLYFVILTLTVVYLYLVMRKFNDWTCCIVGHPITVPRWSCALWTLYVWGLLSQMYAEAICMPKCLILYTCGHGSNTYIQRFAWMSEYFLQNSLYEAHVVFCFSFSRFLEVHSIINSMWKYQYCQYRPKAD